MTQPKISKTKKPFTFRIDPQLKRKYKKYRGFGYLDDYTMATNLGRTFSLVLAHALDRHNKVKVSESGKALSVLYTQSKALDTHPAPEEEGQTPSTYSNMQLGVYDEPKNLELGDTYTSEKPEEGDSKEEDAGKRKPASPHRYLEFLKAIPSGQIIIPNSELQAYAKEVNRMMDLPTLARYANDVLPQSCKLEDNKIILSTAFFEALKEF